MVRSYLMEVNLNQANEQTKRCQCRSVHFGPVCEIYRDHPNRSGTTRLSTATPERAHYMV